MGPPQIVQSWRKHRALVDQPERHLAIAEDWTEDGALICPATGTVVFGRVPEMRVRGGPTFPAGAIYLHYGIHYGPNSGFGFQHIWAEHYKHLGDHEAAMGVITKAVSDILRPNTQVFYVPPKPAPKKKRERANVFRLSAGLVIVELREDANVPFYSVVTGGFNPGEKKGSLIGALDDC